MESLIILFSEIILLIEENDELNMVYLKIRVRKPGEYNLENWFDYECFS